MRDDHLHAVDGQQVGRGVGGAVAVPFPFLVAAREVVGGDAPLLFSAELHDAQAVDHDRRARGEEPRQFFVGIGLAPHDFSAGRVEARERAADAERDDFAVGHGGRASRAGKCEAAPEAGLASYLSDHSSLPVLASRQAMTSSPPRRAKT